MRKQMSETMLEELLPELATRGVRLMPIKGLGKAAKRAVTRHFTEQVLPVLTPAGDRSRSPLPPPPQQER